MKYIRTIKSIVLRLLEDVYLNRLALFVVIIYMVIMQVMFHSTCLAVILFDVTCPGCGLTRAGLSLLHLDLVGAWTLNPTIYLWAVFLAYLFVCRYVLCKKPTFAVPGMIVLGLAMIAAYVW